MAAGLGRVHRHVSEVFAAVVSVLEAVCRNISVAVRPDVEIKTSPILRQNTVYVLITKLIFLCFIEFGETIFAESTSYLDVAHAHAGGR